MSRRLSPCAVERSLNGISIVLASPVVVLHGLLVIDFTRNLPGPFAGRELLRLGARVVRVEAPDGDPLRSAAPGWEAALNAGKESVVWDLEHDPELGPALSRRADVVLEGFRPGVAERLGIGPGRASVSTVYCSLTGFGAGDERAGHDLNYVGWAGLLAALLDRERTGRGAHITVSMTHNAHRLAAHRLHGGAERMLTGGLACYRIYETADGRWITVAALEPKFWSRLCELIGRPELVARHFDEDQETLARELGAVFGSRPLGEWLTLFESKDAMTGPVWTLEEAAQQYGEPATLPAPRLGEHTERWRAELASFGG